MKKRSFIFGTLILSISGLICKVLGAVYKIPLTNILGTEGMGIYYFVFPIYAFLLTLSSASLPVAISSMVSKCIAEDNYKKAYRIFKSSFMLMLFLGTIFTLLLLAFARPLAALQNNSGAYIGYIIIAPAIIVVAIISAFRGYFQGLQNMVPSAISQIVEQIFKLLTGFLLAKLLLPYGLIYGVFGALAGITISEIFALIYLLVYYFIFKKKTAKLPLTGTDDSKIHSLAFKVFKTALPFMLGSVLFPLSLMIDSFLIVNVLSKSGFSNSVATSLFGINVSIISTLVSLPCVLSIAVAMAIVPAISYSKAKGDMMAVKEKISFSVKLAVLVLLPCSIIFICFAPQILFVLFRGGLAGGEYNQLAVASTSLAVAGFSVLSLGLLQVFTAILQGLGKPYIPVVSLAIAVVVKIISEYILLGINEINIIGAVLSNALCFFVAALINLIYLRRQVSFSLKFKTTALTPVIACVMMVITVQFSMLLLCNIIGVTAGILLAFVLGGGVYLGALMLMKTISPEERKLFKIKSE